MYNSSNMKLPAWPTTHWLFEGERFFMPCKRPVCPLWDQSVRLTHWWARWSISDPWLLRPGEDSKGGVWFFDFCPIHSYVVFLGTGQRVVGCNLMNGGLNWNGSTIHFIRLAGLDERQHTHIYQCLTLLNESGHPWIGGQWCCQWIQELIRCAARVWGPIDLFHLLPYIRCQASDRNHMER
jgi:hypothetical protein